jgi:hypothetical protein
LYAGLEVSNVVDLATALTDTDVAFLRVRLV